MNLSLTASIEPQFHTIDGIRIRYADSGGSREPVVLLTSPWPESVYAFSPMWATPSRARRGNVGRAVRGGGSAGAHRERHRRHRRRRRPARAR